MRGGSRPSVTNVRGLHSMSVEQRKLWPVPLPYNKTLTKRQREIWRGLCMEIQKAGTAFAVSVGILNIAVVLASKLEQAATDKTATLRDVAELAAALHRARVDLGIEERRSRMVVPDNY